MKSHRRFGFSATALAVLLSMVGTSPAIASPTTPAAHDATTPAAVGQTYIDSAGVVHYAFDPAERPGAKLVAQAGIAGADGDCSFSGKGPGGIAGLSPHTFTVVDEVSYDPSTCTHQLSVASYSEDTVPSVVQKSTAFQATDSASSFRSGVGPTSTAGLATIATTSWTATLTACIGDPIGIHVSETGITRTWSSSGTWSDSHHWGWYTPSGWSRTSYSQIDNSTLGDTIGKFYNGVFCVGHPTTDTHSMTRIITDTLGDWTPSYVMNKTGGCTNLLSYHYSVVAP